MATLTVDIQSQNRARRELLDLRQQMQDINVQLTQNATQYQKADDAQREKLRTDRTELTLSRRRLQNSAAQVRIYQAESREVERLAREKQKLNRVSQFLSRTFRDLRFHVAGVFTSELIYGATNFVGEIIRIGSETETARATLRQFTDDVDGTFQRLERESQALVNIDLTDIIFSFTQLRGAGADSEESITLIRGFSKSLAELGVTSDETTRFMTQLRQSFSANAIEGDDVKTLIEVMPTFLNRASQSLGIQVESWKDLQDAIDESGKTVRQFYVDLARQQDIQSAGADIDTFRAQTQLLREEWQGFQRDLAQDVIPALTDLIKVVRTGGVALGIFDAPISDNPQLDAAQSRLREVNAQLREVANNLNIIDVDDALGTINANIAQLQDRDAFQHFFTTFQALSGTIEDQRNLYDETNALFEERERLQQRIAELTSQEADAQERITEAVVRRPSATGDFGLTQPFGTFTPQDTVGPFRLTQPDQEFGGLGRRPVYRRPLSEVGPQDIARIPAPLLGSAGARPFIRPDVPIVGPIPDLSGAGSIDPNSEVFTFDRRTRGPQIGLESIFPVTEFQRAIDEITGEIGRNFQQAQREAERDRASQARFTGGLLQSGADTAFGLANIPQDLLGISRSGADQRVDAAARATAEIEELERASQRRIEEIQNNQVISEAERAERILQITQDLAERKTDIETSHAARIAQIEERTANQRRNYYFEFAQSAINDINRVIQRELILRLVRDLSTALPGGLGTGILAVASLGLTAASTGLSAAQSDRSQSLAREQQSRFEGAARSDANFEVTIRNDDGSIRKQNASGRRVYNEGRSAR